MQAQPWQDPTNELEYEQMQQVARSVAAIHWLLLILVLLFVTVPGEHVADRDVVIGASITFAVLILGLRLAPVLPGAVHLKLALESLLMIVFVTVVLLETGDDRSPLVNLYLLPIITSALSLKRWVTVLQVLLICACYVFLSYAGSEWDRSDLLTLPYATGLAGTLAPFLLVAYLTTLLASDIRIASARIRALSETDDLTGFLNMRAFNRLHQREHAKAERYQRSYSLLLLDMDNLKALNDQFGHEAGNRAIRLVASIIKRITRSTDTAARYGGDEFVVLLPETPKPSAMEVAQRIRASVYNATLDLPESVTKTSVSVGVASFPGDGNKIRDLLAKADADMYRDKELRRASSDITLK